MSKSLYLNNEGGCSVKLSSNKLSKLIASIDNQIIPENLLTTLSDHEDACAYKLRPNLAIINTLDFFPPMVESPYLYGQITACNALSDIYAMGGDPLIALNLLAFPVHDYDLTIAQEILQGGAAILQKSKSILGGGHSIHSNSLLYGLSITGTVQPDLIWKMSGAKPGDKIILTKMLGTGIGNLAATNNLLTNNTKSLLYQSQITLNQTTKNIASKYQIHAATDITGYGLIGHLFNIAKASNLQLNIHASQLTYFPELLELVKDGIVPACTYENRKSYENHVLFAKDIPLYIQDLLFDPQTSGGLALALEANQAQSLELELKNNNIIANIIGEFRPTTKPQIKVTNS